MSLTTCRFSPVRPVELLQNLLPQKICVPDANIGVTTVKIKVYADIDKTCVDFAKITVPLEKITLIQAGRNYTNTGKHYTYYGIK